MGDASTSLHIVVVDLNALIYLGSPVYVATATKPVSPSSAPQPITSLVIEVVTL